MRVGYVTGKSTCFSYNIAVEDNTLQRGEFVVSEHPIEGLVLGRVGDIIKERNETTAYVRVIGFKNAENKIRIPRIPVSPESNVWRADATIVSNILKMPKSGLYVGMLEGSDLKIFLNSEKIVSKHISILAQSGSGKSYAAGVLIEELAEKNYPVIIIDPHGEYGTLKQPNWGKDSESSEKFGVERKGFKNVIEYNAGENIKLSSERFSLIEIKNILPSKLNSTATAVLFEAIRKAREKNGNYTLWDIIEELTKIESNAKWGIIAYLEEIANSEIFSEEPFPIKKLATPGVKIINLRKLSTETQQIFVSRLLKELFEKRKADEIPPFFLVVEEAHNFAPERNFGEVASSRIIRKIASEGRKFGIGLCTITQRPARIDKNIISQCGTHIILRMSNSLDIKAVASAVEGFDNVMSEEMRTLPTGVAIISGDALGTSMVVEIRTRKSMHGGESAVGGKIKKILEHPFWVIKLPDGDLACDAKYGVLYSLKNNYFVEIGRMNSINKLKEKLSSEKFEKIEFGEITNEESRIKKEDIKEIIKSIGAGEESELRKITIALVEENGEIKIRVMKQMENDKQKIRYPAI